MKLKIPTIRTREDYYRALFGTPRDEVEESSPVIDNLKAEAKKRKKELEGNFHIQELPDRYVLHNLEYHDGIYSISWSKTLLDSGQSHNQEDWINRTQNADWQKQNGLWQIPSAPLYHATIAALYENQDHPVSEQQDLVQAVKEVFQKDFQNNWMMTSTRAKYAGKTGLLRKKKQDTMTHDWNTPTARTVQGTFVGTNGYVTASCGFETMLEAILESKDLTLIEEAYEWIGQQNKKPYLWRVNNRPNNDDEWPVVLGVSVNNDRFIVAYDNVYDNWPARGVVTQRKKFLHEK